MRLGAVTHRGYGELIFQRFGPIWGWTSTIDLVVTNLITLITEVIAIRVGMAFFGVPPVLILASNIGATVTPWMLFFQQSASVDKDLTPKDIPHGRLDTLIGTVLAALAGCAVLVATSTLFTHHVDTRAELIKSTTR